MIIHCHLNSQTSFKPSEIKTLFKIEFYDRGYWSKIYNVDTLEDAKDRLLKERPNSEYKRMKKRSKINTKKTW
jgi:hypothetical protein